VPTGALKLTVHVTLAPAVLHPLADAPTLTVVESAEPGVAPSTERRESVIDCVAGETNFGARRCELVCTGVYCWNETDNVAAALGPAVAVLPIFGGLTDEPPPPPPPHALKKTQTKAAATERRRGSHVQPRIVGHL